VRIRTNANGSTFSTKGVLSEGNQPKSGLLFHNIFYDSVNYCYHGSLILGLIIMFVL